ncbi:MAG: hypothetical protein JWN70_5736 [Planctomycetaceae bacterium]|nr:hypothetical protein [Planctomycetaceae bacterium]
MRNRLLAILHLLTVVLFTSGCRPAAVTNNPTATNEAMKSDSADTSNWLTINKSIQAIQQARELAQKAENERLQRIFSSISTDFFLDLEMVSLLERHRDEAMQRLHSMLPKDRVTDEGVGAALILCRLSDPRGREFASRVLSTGNTEQRRRLLSGLDSGIYGDLEEAEHLKFLSAEPDLVARLLQQLDDTDPKVVSAAIQFCGIRKVPGARDHFLKLLQRPDVPDRDRLLYCLSSGELTPDIFEFALKSARPINPESCRNATIFEEFAKRSPEPLKTLAKDHLREIIQACPDDGKKGYGGDRLGILTALAESAEIKDLPWLKQLAASEQGLYATHLLEAWIRLDPMSGRGTLFRWLSSEERRRTAIQAAATAFAKTADAEIIERLATLANSAERGELSDICTALNSIGGPAVHQAIERVGQKLDPSDLAQFQQSARPTPPAELLEAVRQSGVLSPDELAAAAKRRSLRQQDSKADQYGLFEVFADAESATGFDVETGMLPCRHDELVTTLAKSTRGRFVPTAAHETWHQKNADDYEAPYTLQFVMNDRLYQAQIRNKGDWYDLERVITMVNTAVSDAGHKERFIALATGGQVAMFVFADPEKLLPLAKRFHMALSQDLEEAMKKGIEFDELVRDRYKNE